MRVSKLKCEKRFGAYKTFYPHKELLLCTIDLDKILVAIQEQKNVLLCSR